ncbi:HD domain-containing protein [Clostridium aestuarii]|uniref:HD domain-containing protein n=1 Tax=Clostridium aestuarii TaxID=338193 RepID=A0ABT4D123_9CLOT|nr:HD domain-containing protein [Clostridium aestuarii]MCY6484797.1 HD domain-containing protein [Clostridium aestuarii]
MKFAVEDIKNILNDIGGTGYIIGGYIRDKMTNHKNNIKDIDIIYEGNIGLFINKLKEKGYSVFPLKQDKGIYRASKEAVIIDIAELKGNDIEEDLKSRDFTINAVALKLIDNKIIDIFDGRKHMKSRIIHEVSPNSIKNDKIRILRAFRFAIKYDMHFSKSCQEHIIEESKYIKDCPKERILSELMQIIEHDNNGIAFEELDKYHVLKNLIPYVDELKVIGKCKYHIEDAFTHMKLVYKNFKEVLQQEQNINGLELNIFNEQIGEFKTREYAAFAAFCHDIGKAKCYRKIGERVSFIGHDEQGAIIMREVCRKLGFPKRAQKLIIKLVEAHMYPLSLCKNKVKNPKKSFYKFFSRYNEYIPYILTLSYCDMHATKMLYDPDNEEEEFINYIERLFEEYSLYKKVKGNRFFNGKEIIEFTGAKGEQIKEILEELDRLTYYGQINSREEAIKWIKG